MNRLDLDQTVVAQKTAALRAQYPDSDTPCPGSRLQVGDDVRFQDGMVGRIVWGCDYGDYFHVYAPDSQYGQNPVAACWRDVVDRAPLDPNDPTPMLLWL